MRFRSGDMESKSFTFYTIIAKINNTCHYRSETDRQSEITLRNVNHLCPYFLAIRSKFGFSKLSLELMVPREKK